MSIGDINRINERMNKRDQGYSKGKKGKEEEYMDPEDLEKQIQSQSSLAKRKLHYDSSMNWIHQDEIQQEEKLKMKREKSKAKTASNPNLLRKGSSKARDLKKCKSSDQNAILQH